MYLVGVVDVADEGVDPRNLFGGDPGRSKVRQDCRRVYYVAVVKVLDV